MYSSSFGKAFEGLNTVMKPERSPPPKVPVDPIIGLKSSFASVVKLNAEINAAVP